MEPRPGARQARRIEVGVHGRMSRTRHAVAVRDRNESSTIASGERADDLVQPRSPRRHRNTVAIIRIARLWPGAERAPEAATAATTPLDPIKPVEPIPEIDSLE